MHAHKGGLGSIGRYELLKELGAGGMGRVYLGQHMDSKWRRAIKTMAVDGDEYPELEERFIREVQAAIRVRHENVVEIYELGRDERAGLLYYIMEHLEGQDLANRLDERGPFSWQEARDILIQIARGLHAAHEVGIVHRDVKPHNCIAVGDTKREVIKVIDFGICKDLRPEGDRLPTITGHVIGSPVYISPEQALGKKDIDLRTDIYSLGVTAYQLLLGEPPFRGEVGELIVAHVSTPPRSLREHPAGATIPPALDDIVLKCLSKKREHRYGSMKELEQALVAVDTPDTAAVATRHWQRTRSRRRVLPMLAASLGLVAAISLTFLVVQNQGQTDAATPVSESVVLPDATARPSPKIAPTTPAVVAVATGADSLPVVSIGVEVPAQPEIPSALAVDETPARTVDLRGASKDGNSGIKPVAPMCVAAGWSYVATRMKALATSRGTRLPESLAVSYERSGGGVKVSVPKKFERTSTERIARDAFSTCRFGKGDPLVASKTLAFPRTEAAK